MNLLINKIFYLINLKEPKKVTTGAKRGRKPASEKKEEPESAVKPTPAKRGRKPRSRESETSVENNENAEQVAEDAVEQPAVENEEEKLTTEANSEAKEETVAAVKEDVKETVNEVESESKEEPAPVVTTKEEKTATINETVEKSSEPVAPKVEESKPEPVVEQSKESTKNSNEVAEVKEPEVKTNDIVNNETNNGPKASVNQVNDQVSKVLESNDDQAAKKLTNEPVTNEKPEVQTA